MTTRRLVLLHLAFTLAMVGVMTTVQFVVYPQYTEVAVADFSNYVRSHGQRIGVPLVLFAPAEVALAFVVWLRLPSGRVRAAAFGSGALLALAWVVTMVWFAPLHGRLISEPYDADRIDQLVNTNWLRTVLWWARGGAAVWLAAQLSHLGSAD
jgi:hypothetical protein